ncbi:MAG: hypothetical protein A2Z78_01800 [Candidatus Nealsonbacteria bacterium RBG_13_36_15]|uniref:Uncharacterized protein n=1 Tax=Candidatus Nealsonbacteria bacterium RBG_13_36_15 TaxID=1801660 RepID=A0A1G2DWB8_9BACT|nr:MAG: hypothetical protein A2Z78_01800 [Candidatus Nealsonbacteria bacterium RBG_13_36_15]
MATKINTPAGPQLVVSPEEHEVMQAVRNGRFLKGRCRYCNTRFRLATVSYCYRIRGSPLTGKGTYRRINEVIKYCPKCEGKPRRQGHFIV